MQRIKKVLMWEVLPTIDLKVTADTNNHNKFAREVTLDAFEKNVILRKQGFVSISVTSHKIRVYYTDYVNKTILKLTG